MSTLLDVGLTNAVMATLLAVLAAGVTALCRRPALAHSLWLLVFLKLLTPAVVPLPLPWSAVEAAPDELSASSAEVPEPAEAAEVPGAAPLWDDELETDALDLPALTAQPEAASEVVWLSASWRELVGLLWLAGSLLWFGWTALHLYRFQRLLCYARPAPAALQAQVRELADRLGLLRCPSVWLVPGAVSPMVWALGTAPRLLLPARLFERLDPEQQATLLVHELAHVRRGDHWVRLVELVASGLYWWHPVVWWARRQLHEAEEQCCDAWVVSALAGSGQVYARALVQTVAFFSQTRSRLPAAASGIGQASQLRRRLTMILQGKTSRSLSWSGWLAVLCLGLLLPLAPVRAEPPPQDRGREQDARDREIEALRKKIKALEAQKRADQEAASKQGDSAAVEKARGEVERLAKQIEERRKELQGLEARLREVSARLASAQSGKKESAPEDTKRVTKVQKDAPGDRRPTPKAAPGGLPGPDFGKEMAQFGREMGKFGQEIGQLAQKMAQFKTEGKDKEFAQVKEQMERLKEQIKEKTQAQVKQKLHRELGQIKAKTVQPKPEAGAKRPDDLERKLDRLLKEVDELRREMRREKR